MKPVVEAHFLFYHKPISFPSSLYPCCNCICTHCDHFHAFTPIRCLNMLYMRLICIHPHNVARSDPISVAIAKILNTTWKWGHFHEVLYGYTIFAQFLQNHRYKCLLPPGPSKRWQKIICFSSISCLLHNLTIVFDVVSHYLRIYPYRSSYSLKGTVQIASTTSGSLFLPLLNFFNARKLARLAFSYLLGNFSYLLLACIAWFCWRFGLFFIALLLFRRILAVPLLRWALYWRHVYTRRCTSVLTTSIRY